jgi:membrane-bound lytic murein transglycosylase B
MCTLAWFRVGIGAQSCHKRMMKPDKSNIRSMTPHLVPLLIGPLLIASGMALVSCSSAPDVAPVPVKIAAPVAPPTPVAPPVPAPVVPSAYVSHNGQPFDVWRAALRQEALSRGISARVFDQAFEAVTPSERVIGLDRGQSEGKASYMSYLRNHLTGSKIAAAQSAYEMNTALLNKAQADHGVPGNVIVGIWGMETNFGSFIGNFPMIQALASLAYDGRRSAMFREELFAALTMMEKGDATLSQMRGSWAGAFGQPQFMPSSYLRYAVDGDANGNRDIWNSLPDVFGSIGNYLKQVGWAKGQGWGLAVAPPAGFNPATVATTVEPTKCKAALRKHSLPKAISAWKALGFVPNGNNGWPTDTAMATLVQPDGPEGPSFLTLPNYQTILNYNCSNFYALSVLLLADAAAQ